LEGVVLPEKALVLGTGGAASAVSFVLRQQGIPFLQVSRTSGRGDLTYAEVTEEVLRDYRFIINCTPVGTLGEQQRLLSLPYEALTSAHYLYDLVYNPEVTPFLEKGEQYGARTQNGLKMLHLQAEAAWRIWRNSEE
jgi:shikimate dehydrogenase